MRDIRADLIKDTIAELCIDANIQLRPDILRQLKAFVKKETNSRAKMLLNAIIENAAIAAKTRTAICQDTGLPVVFAELGQDAHIVGGRLNAVINEGVNIGYVNGYLRNSVVSDPISRPNPKFAPAVIHTDIVSGSSLKLIVLPKGFGCENKSQAKMFRPTASIEEIKDFIVEVVRQAGPDACPPFVVGVGIGGTQDYACLLAKKALLRNIEIRNPKPETRKLEHDLLSQINKLNIGPMGLGGETTALGVNIETFPTHIAGLPVAVNISCHATRSASRIL